jgi:hypothetical protein
MKPLSVRKFLGLDVSKSRTDTVIAPRLALARFPSLVLSYTRGTVLVVRSSNMDPTQPSVQMSWTGEEPRSTHAPAATLPPSCVTRSSVTSDLYNCTDTTRRAYPRPRWSILLLQKLITHVAYIFFRHRHLRTDVLRSTCLLHQIRGCRGFGKRRYRAILADKPR